MSGPTPAVRQAFERVVSAVPLGSLAWNQGRQDSELTKALNQVQNINIGGVSIGPQSNEATDIGARSWNAIKGLPSQLSQGIQGAYSNFADATQNIGVERGPLANFNAAINDENYAVNPGLGQLKGAIDRASRWAFSSLAADDNLQSKALRQLPRVFGQEPIPQMKQGLNLEGFKNLGFSHLFGKSWTEAAISSGALDNETIGLSELPGIAATMYTAYKTPGTDTQKRIKLLQAAQEAAGGALKEKTAGEAIKRAVGEAFGYDDRGRLRSSSAPATNRDLTINQLAPSLRSSSNIAAQETSATLTDWLSSQETARQQYTDELSRLSSGRADLAASIADYEKKYDDKIDPGILGSWDTALADVQKQQSDFDTAQRSALVSYQQQQDVYNRPTTWGVRGLENLAQSPKQAFGRRERAKKKTTTQAPTISNLAATWGAPMTLNV